jgi:hypothetical protein
VSLGLCRCVSTAVAFMSVVGQPYVAREAGQNVNRLTRVDARVVECRQHVSAEAIVPAGRHRALDGALVA